MWSEQDLQDSKKYQRWLADSLVGDLGFDRATKVCMEMCWYGTLDFLIKQKDSYSANAAQGNWELTPAA